RLIGDASRARAVLGWRPSVSFEGLVHMMVDADVAALAPLSGRSRAARAPAAGAPARGGGDGRRSGALLPPTRSRPCAVHGLRQPVAEPPAGLAAHQA